MSEERDHAGKFKAGNPGGPGRPRRTIEADYLRAITEIVPLDDWRKIVETARAKALEGDDKARAWLSKYLLGDGPPRLAKLAALEAENVDPVEVERRRVKVQEHQYAVWGDLA